MYIIIIEIQKTQTKIVIFRDIRIQIKCLALWNETPAQIIHNSKAIKGFGMNLFRLFTSRIGSKL